MNWIDILLRNADSFYYFSCTIPPPSSLYFGCHDILKRLTFVFLKPIKFLLDYSHFFINFLNGFGGVDVKTLLSRYVFELVLLDITSVEVVFQKHGGCYTLYDYLIHESFSLKNPLCYLLFIHDFLRFVFGLHTVIIRPEKLVGKCSKALLLFLAFFSCFGLLLPIV